jgi:hypothetical protein
VSGEGYEGGRLVFRDDGKKELGGHIAEGDFVPVGLAPPFTLGFDTS